MIDERIPECKALKISTRISDEYKKQFGDLEVDNAIIELYQEYKNKPPDDILKELSKSLHNNKSNNSQDTQNINHSKETPNKQKLSNESKFIVQKDVDNSVEQIKINSSEKNKSISHEALISLIKHRGTDFAQETLELVDVFDSEFCINNKKKIFDIFINSKIMDIEKNIADDNKEFQSEILKGISKTNEELLNQIKNNIEESFLKNSVENFKTAIDNQQDSQIRNVIKEKSEKSFHQIETSIGNKIDELCKNKDEESKAVFTEIEDTIHNKINSLVKINTESNKMLLSSKKSIDENFVQIYSDNKNELKEFSDKMLTDIKNLYFCDIVSNFFKKTQKLFYYSVTFLFLGIFIGLLLRPELYEVSVLLTLDEWLFYPLLFITPVLAGIVITLFIFLFKGNKNKEIIDQIK